MLRFSENIRSTGLATTTNPRTSMSAHGLPEATQSQAEAGVATGRYMSPLRVFQAIAAYLTGIFGSGISTFLATPSSANLKAAVTDGTGSGALVFGTSPTLSGATLGGTTSVTGGQLAFPATQSASSDANTLDDYEEGTWTPVLTFATPGDLSVTYSTQTGFYTKIGRTVVLQGTIFTSAFTHSTASGNLQITGVPFAAVSSRSNASMRWQGITKASFTDVIAHISVGASAVEAFACGSGQSVTAIAPADTPSGGSVQLAFTLMYIT